jgi:hypothetical protein
LVNTNQKEKVSSSFANRAAKSGMYLVNYIDAVGATDGKNLRLLEFGPASWWHQVLHNQSAWFIRSSVVFSAGRYRYQRTICGSACCARRMSVPGMARSHLP